MRVVMYSPQRLFGFCGPGDPQPGQGQVFFHAGTFQASGEPGPVVGELVSVDYDPHNVTKNAPRATRVLRMEDPPLLRGTVDTFDARRGWGFIKDDTGGSVYLHRSEMMTGQLPMAGRRVEFYVGTRQGKSRACYVKIIEA